VAPGQGDVAGRATMAPPRTLLALALFATVLLLVGAPVAAEEESQEGGLPLVEQLAGLVWNRNVGSIDGGDAFRTQAERTVKDAVAAGANLDSMDHEGRTPLHWAAANGEVAVVQVPPRPATLEATQGQMDDFFSQLPYKCHQNRSASVAN